MCERIGWLDAQETRRESWHARHADLAFGEHGRRRNEIDQRAMQSGAARRPGSDA
jgi:hypothetical protein